MLLNFLILSNFINNSFDYYLIKSKKFDFVNNSQILFSSQKISVENIGIVDFRFILKKSNAMKILGDKFILLENEMNKKMKIKQNYLKNKESFIKKQKSNLSVLKYNEKLDLFKKEV